jgi:hypothetical protein
VVYSFALAVAVWVIVAAIAIANRQQHFQAAVRRRAA